MGCQMIDAKASEVVEVSAAPVETAIEDAISKYFEEPKWVDLLRGIMMRDNENGG